MTSSVMNMASEMSTWLGGSDWVPSACRNMLSTTTTRTKQVVIKRIAGARLSTVSSSITWIVELSPSGLAHFSGPPVNSCGTLSVSGLWPASSARAAVGAKAPTSNQGQRQGASPKRAIARPSPAGNRRSEI